MVSLRTRKGGGQEFLKQQIEVHYRWREQRQSLTCVRDNNFFLCFKPLLVVIILFTLIVIFVHPLHLTLYVTLSAGRKIPKILKGILALAGFTFSENRRHNELESSVITEWVKEKLMHGNKILLCLTAATLGNRSHMVLKMLKRPIHTQSKVGNRGERNQYSTSHSATLKAGRCHLSPGVLRRL